MMTAPAGRQSAATRTIAPRRLSPPPLLLLLDSNAGCTRSSLIAMHDWIGVAIVEAADPRSHRNDPLVFASSRIRCASHGAPPLTRSSAASESHLTPPATSTEKDRGVATVRRGVPPVQRPSHDY